MDKKMLSSIIAFADSNVLIKLAEKIEKKHEVQIIKQPSKTMVMVQVKEPVKSSKFFIGEMLASECFVEVDGTKGAAVIMGDDIKKVRAAAVLDAAHTAKFEEFKSVETKLIDLEKQRIEKRKREAAIFRQTQVDFKILEDDYAE